MTFLQPVSWPEVLAARAAHPEAVAVAGGTDVLVEINFHRLHPAAVLDLGRVRELRDRSRPDGAIRLGAGVTSHDVIAGLRADLPGLAMAARTIALHPDRRSVGAGIGSVGPVRLRASAAETFLEGVLEEGDRWQSRGPLDGRAVSRFADLVGQAAQPIDDVRGSAAYRVHALRVLRRMPGWAWEEYGRVARP